MAHFLDEVHARRLIVKACQALYLKNLVAASDGNVSARLDAKRILITPSGCSKGDVREHDILVCNLAGRRLAGAGRPSVEIQLHLTAYRARPDVGGVIHAHPPVANAFTFAGREELLREPIVPEVSALFGPIPCAPYVMPGTRKLAAAAGPLFKRSDLVLLRQHGAVALGPDPWTAFLRLEKLEYFAVVVKHALELCGGDASAIRRLSRKQVAELQATYGKA